MRLNAPFLSTHRKRFSRLLIGISIISFVACKTDSPVIFGNRADILGNWEGRDTEGAIRVLLTIDASNLVIEYTNNGKPTRLAYTVYDEAGGKEMKIDGFEERFIIQVRADETMRLNLTAADARQESVPLISMLTFHRRR